MGKLEKVQKTSTRVTKSAKWLIRDMKEAYKIIRAC